MLSSSASHSSISSSGQISGPFARRDAFDPARQSRNRRASSGPALRILTSLPPSRRRSADGKENLYRDAAELVPEVPVDHGGRRVQRGQREALLNGCAAAPRASACCRHHDRGTPVTRPRRPRPPSGPCRPPHHCSKFQNRAAATISSPSATPTYRPSSRNLTAYFHHSSRAPDAIAPNDCLRTRNTSSRWSSVISTNRNASVTPPTLRRGPVRHPQVDRAFDNHRAVVAHGLDLHGHVRPRRPRVRIRLRRSRSDQTWTWRGRPPPSPWAATVCHSESSPRPTPPWPPPSRCTRQSHARSRCGSAPPAASAAPAPRSSGLTCTNRGRIDRKYGAFHVNARENTRSPPGTVRNRSHIPNT